MDSNTFLGVADGAVALVTIDDQASFGDLGTDWNGLTVDPILTYTTTDGEVTITDCDRSAAGELVIPETIEGNAVTSIGEGAFGNCTNLTSINIPDSVTSILSATFASCSSLTSINIPDTVTSIGNNAFASCSSLPSITIPDSVTSIGNNAFANCSSLPSITIPDSVTSIGSNAFQNSPAVIRFSKDMQIAQIEAQLAQMTAERDAAIEERDARPTQASYDDLEDALVAMTADRDSRPTLAEVQDARVGSIILSKDWESGEVSLCFGLQKTDDFVTWEAFEGGTWSEALNSKFKLTLPLGEAKKWLRLTMPE